MNEFPREFGDYTLLDELGRGGMGIVYRAVQKSLSRTVALKVLNVSQDWASDTTLARFKREGEVMARLAHPDIVQVFDSGVHEDRVFIAMELVRGEPLDRHLRTSFPPLEQSLTIVARVARALYHGHQQGIVHRDVKPSNILVDVNGNPKLTDFGLAKVEGVKLSQSGALMGTPAYMSPEQATGEAIDARSDVYSLGAVMYELITGGAPHVGTSVQAIIQRVIHAEPPPPRVVNPKLPRDVDTMCLRALSKGRDHRYPTALAFAEDVERWLRGEPILARAAGPVERAWRWVMRRRMLSAAVLALSLLTAAMTVIAVVLSRRVRRQEAASADIRQKQEQSQAEQRRTSQLITLEAEGFQLMKSDRLAEALERFAEVAREIPDSARVRLAKGTCHWLLAQPGEAETEFAAYLKLKPDDAQAWRMRGLNFIDIGDFARAVPCYREAADLWKVDRAALASDNRDYDVLFALVERQAASRDVQYARRWYGEYNPSIILKGKQETYPLSNKWWETFQQPLRFMPGPEVMSFLELHGDHPAALARVADYKRGVGREGLPFLERALALLPFWPKLWTWRAQILKQDAASPPEVESSYAKALAICPRFGDALLGSAEWKKSFGRFEEALAAYRAILDDWKKLRFEEAEWSEQREAAMQCIRCAAALGRTAEACEILRTAKSRWGVKLFKEELARDGELKALQENEEFRKALEALD